MADTGFIEHDDNREGGTLELTGLDGETRRVFAGPHFRRHADGIAAVYATGREVGSLSARSDDGAASGAALVLRAVPDGAERAEQTVHLDGGTHDEPLGSLTLSSASNPGWSAFLGFDPDFGRPLLALSDWDEQAQTGNVVVLSTQGLMVLPSKENFRDNFVAPMAGNPGKAIHYCVVEGPEVGVQIRGTATLRNGRATVRLPDHFAQVAAETRLTAHLTPRSARSRGVAATSLTREELVIEELADGQGCYDVDWFVQGVRKGQEGYEVVRPWAPAAVPTIRRRGESAE